jgi:two-component system phosphate regulon sensor histidine kinase PhoR
VLGDARRIEQVLINLVDNATKYSPDGTEIRIVWEMGTGANLGETVLKVKDSGPGVAEDHLPRLFERFYRVDAGRAREVGGTGLGLAIVKHIVLSHGGSIAVRSKLGEGAEFLCRFPSR